MKISTAFSNPWDRHLWIREWHCSLHFKTWNKFNASLELDLCWNCQVLKQVFSVT